MYIGSSLVVSGACLFRSNVSKLWKGNIEVSVEYGESYMYTENYVKLIFLRLRKYIIFLLTLGVFDDKINSIIVSNEC